MDKNLKKLKPAALNFLRSRYTEIETHKRWLKVERLYNKWLREEGDLGGSANMMSSNLTFCYAMCAFYEAADRIFNSEDFNILFNEVMAKQSAMRDNAIASKLSIISALNSAAVQHVTSAPAALAPSATLIAIDSVLPVPLQ